MANDDDADSASGGASNTPDGQVKASAPKDRQCPFCQTPFTSSSLGRHLDLYIKDKNPRPPDGIHDVARIRQIRNKVTRRHPKGSLAAAKNQLQQPGAAGSSPSQPPGAGPAESYVRAMGQERARVFDGALEGVGHLPRPDWQATGVMNELAAREERPGGAGTPSTGNIPWTRRGAGAGRDVTASAAEAALRDVLDNLRRAAFRMQRPGAFDYDVLSLNFPALCLKLLPAPPTLFSTTPSHSPTSWPIETPDSGQLEHVKASIRRRIRGYMQVCPPMGTRLCKTRDEVDALIGAAVAAEYARYEEHVECVHRQWTELLPEQRQQVWHLEVMRALAKAVRDFVDVNAKYHRALDQIDDLRSDSEHARSTRRANRAPTVSASLLREVADIGSDPKSWNYQLVMDQYRDALLAGAAGDGGGAAAHGLADYFAANAPDPLRQGSEGYVPSVEVEMGEERAPG